MPYKDPQEAKEQKRKYYLAHKEHLLQKMKEWCARNPEKVREMRRGIKKRFYHRHLEESRAKERLRAKKRNAQPLTKERKNKWYLDNKEAVIRKSVECRRLRPEYGRKHYEENKARYFENVKKYQAAHPEAVKRAKRDGNQKRRKMAGKHSYGQWLARMEFYGWACAYCRTPVTESTAHRDHIIPCAKHGTNWASNIAPACKKCNHKKHVKLWATRQPKPKSPLP